MKKSVTIMMLAIVIFLLPTQETKAINIVAIIKAAVVKVIKAVDLRIQRQQNKVIRLQNAQKKLENTMSKLKLKEITSWVEKQRDLYKEYYEELAQVKSIIKNYRRIEDITEKQVKLMEEYKRAWLLFQQDEHFTRDELNYMERVYSGILKESEKNIDQIFLIVESLTTKMSDAKRLEIINSAANRMEANYNDLMRFNQQNKLLCLQRAKDQNDAEAIKRLYGLE